MKNKMKFLLVLWVILLSGCAVPVIVNEIATEVLEGKRIDKENKRANADTKDDTKQLKS
jgi:outer membrane murein-binding lipoprotein Lpp